MKNYKNKNPLNCFLFGFFDSKAGVLFWNLPELVKFMVETPGHKYFDHPKSLMPLIWEQLVPSKRPIYNHYKSYKLAVEAKLKAKNLDMVNIKMYLERFDMAFRDYAFEQMKSRE